MYPQKVICTPNCLTQGVHVPLNQNVSGNADSRYVRFVVLSFSCFIMSNLIGCNFLVSWTGNMYLKSLANLNTRNRIRKRKYVKAEVPRQFTDKTVHRHVFWRQFTDKIGDSSPTDLKTVHRQNIIRQWKSCVFYFFEKTLKNTNEMIIASSFTQTHQYHNNPKIHEWKVQTQIRCLGTQRLIRVYAVCHSPSIVVDTSTCTKRDLYKI